MAAADEPKVRPLLPFADPWELRTRPFAFESAKHSDAGYPLSLNHLRDMTGQRNSACVRETSKLTCSPETREWFRKYLANLDAFIKEEGRRTDMVFEWTSPLSGRFFKMAALDGVEKERAMATFLYGGLLRELAHQHLGDMLGLTPGAQAAEGEARVQALADVTALLRQASGVFNALSERLLPALTGLKSDRPFELLPGVASAMGSVALAEAQQLAAFRLEERGGGAATIASLHAAAGDLYDRALRELKSDGAEKEISDRLKRYLGCAAALTAARGHKHSATEQSANLQSGAAERACVEAKSLLQSALNAADVDADWKAVLEAESKIIENRRLAVEKDRLYVSMQPIPREAPPLPAGKVLVSALPWEGEGGASVSGTV
ncbi:MAG: BRO1 domain-containing protein [Monoraphidium minutum]|nr:MAG: BRO1 domain-containing protein [Monoraphidium minutum]